MTRSVKSLNIILMEDNSDDAFLVHEALSLESGNSIQLATVTSFKDGIKEILSKTWDLILMSLSLPDLYGLEAIKEIQELADAVPVIVLGNSFDDRLETEALKEGVQDYLSKKEMSAEYLYRSIRHAVERNKAESGYQKRYRKFFESVLESSSVATYTADLAKNIGFWNQAAERLLGWKKEEILGCPFSFFHGESVDEEERSQKLLIENRLKVYERDCRGFRKDGTVIDINLATSALRDSQGKVIGTVTVISDIQKQKLTQLRSFHADRMATMGILIAGVAHEINNPLAYTIGSLELAQEELTRKSQSADALKKSLKPHLKRAEEGVRRIQEIVRELKAFEISEEDKTETVDLRKVLESTIEKIANQIQSRATLDFEFTDIPKVHGNSEKLSQVFLNLILNAAESFPDGNPPEDVAKKQNIKVKTQLSNQGEAVIEISDTGSGIAPEILERIYDPFFTTKPMGLGKGLGLSICYAIVSAYGGHIEVESEIGIGSTFRITFPVAISSKAPEKKSKPEGKPDPQSEKSKAKVKPKVLIIDDEPDLTEVLCRLLKPHTEITVINRPEEALSLLQTKPDFDIILCDLMMPRMSGMEIYETLKSEGSPFPEKMIFMTGGAFTPRSTSFLASVSNLRIEKPFNTEDVRNLFSLVLK